MKVFLQPERILGLCAEIGMPGEVTQRMAELARSYDFEGLDEPFAKLFNADKGLAGVRAITERIVERGDAAFIWLAVWMGAALRTREKYRLMHIPDAVFRDTMGCFSRFVKEHMVSYGTYGFDRSEWTYRQTAMQLFRLGELEFEMTHYSQAAQPVGDCAPAHGESVLSVHIPSDARLDGGGCQASYRAAVEFFDSYYPDYSYKWFYCGTWLLSPALRELLPEGSGILNFQKDYRMISVDTENASYKLWVYKNPTLEPEDFPERTSLQRAVKRHVQNGGKIGTGTGVISREAIMHWA